MTDEEPHDYARDPNSARTDPDDIDNVVPTRRPIAAHVGGLVDEVRLTLGVHGEHLAPEEGTSRHRAGRAT